MSDCRPGYWAIIPADVRYDDALPANAKLLYGEISALCDQRGYCYASNAYFSRLYGWSVATIQRLLSALRSQGYIRIYIVRDQRTGEVKERRIYAGLQQGVTPPLKNEGRSPRKKGDPPLENDFANNVDHSEGNIPPHPPTGGADGKSYFLPLKDGTNYEVTPSELDRLQGRFPALDVEQQVRSMLTWLEASPEKRKTRRGIGRFIASWLSRRADQKASQAFGAAGGGEGGMAYEDRELL